MPVSRVSRKKAVPSRVDFAKRPAGDEDEPSDFMRRFPEQMAQMERERASLVAASKARQEALDVGGRHKGQATAQTGIEMLESAKSDIQWLMTHRPAFRDRVMNRTMLRCAPGVPRPHAAVT